MTLTLLTAMAVLLALGFLAWHGPSRPSPPHCRRCDFDLSGLSSPTTCPECGAGLDVRGMVRHNRRVRRPGLAKCLAVLALLCGIGAATTWLSGQPGLVRYTPEFVLRRDVEAGLPARAEMAFGELERRIAATPTDKARLERLSSSLLKRCGNPAMTWPPPMADRIWNAYASGLLSPNEMQRYEDIAVQSITFEARGKVRQGQRPIAVLKVGTTRAAPSAWSGNPAAIQYSLSGETVLVEMDNAPQSGDRKGTSEVGQFRGAFSNSSGITTSVLTEQVDAVGPATIRYRARVQLLGVDPSVESPGRIINIERTQRIEVVDRNANVVMLDPSPAHSPRFKQSVGVEGVTLALADGSFGIKESGQPPVAWTAGAVVSVSEALPAVAFRVFMRASVGSAPESLPDVEIGTLAWSDGSRSTTMTWGRPLSDPQWLRFIQANTPPQDPPTGPRFADENRHPGLRVDLVCRPDRAIAEQSLLDERIWWGELIFRDAPVVIARDGRWPKVYIPMPPASSRKVPGAPVYIKPSEVRELPLPE